MKTSILTPDDALHTAAENGQALAGSALHRFARAIYSKLNQMGTAIALGESGDLDGAQEWRKQHGAN